MENILRGRERVLTNQRSGLLGLLAQAQSAGNAEQVDNLVDQIDELNTQLHENKIAIRENTTAAFNFRTQQINEAAAFSQGVFGSAQSFFQALTERTGINTNPQQVAALQGTGTSLQAQQGGLSSQLASLIRDNTVLGLNGADLVDYLVSISSGPAFKAIMDRLDPTQETAFKDLINALLGNATAVEQNTQSINQLTQPGAQSFASTLWSTFRQAVFTGAGGLLPQYQMTVPTAATGARVLASGMLVAHAGETIRPAEVSRDYGREGGDTYQLNVTTPTEVLNPTDVARQLAFYRKSQGRR
jgi:regulator of replication initiation timing